MAKQQDMAALIAAAVAQAMAGQTPEKTLAKKSGGCPGYDGESCGKAADPRSTKRHYCPAHFRVSMTEYVAEQVRRQVATFGPEIVSEIAQRALDGAAVKDRSKRSKAPKAAPVAESHVWERAGMSSDEWDALSDATRKNIAARVLA